MAKHACDGLLDPAAVAKLIGLSRRTVVRWAHDGRIPSLRLGRQVRFEEAVIAEWLARHRTGQDALLPPVDTARPNRGDRSDQKPGRST
ncbi:MAG: helix-turn-helix domain-containing protein [Phycisphaerae bacterium]|nr:helix-turn-helix domain-containing protein [Phycisphaerae bacterium]